MKGVSILKPLTLTIETKAESWIQGAKVEGTLKVSSTESLDLKDITVALGLADLKKVHAKAANCFKISNLTAVENAEFPFSFELETNAPVTDKKSSLHLLYGKMDSPFHLQLNVLPKPLFLEVVKLFDTFFRFKVKDTRSAKSGVEFHLLPPPSKEFAQVEALYLYPETEGENLKLTFHFDLKKIDWAGGGTKMIKEEKKIEKILGPKEFMMGKTHLDQDKLLKILESVLAEVKTRVS